MPTIIANGAELYYEIRGKGPSLLLIHGGGVDGGTFKKLADVLASDFTVVAYDRRGLSRSPRPTDWKQTSIAEQAEDAAGLLRALRVAPAAVVGQSLGALIALELLLRHPDLVRRANLLDPGPLDSAIPDRQQKFALLPESEAIRTGIATGGPEAGFEALLRGLGAWDAMDPGPTKLYSAPTGCPSRSVPEARHLRFSGKWPSGSPPGSMSTWYRVRAAMSAT
jgi:pimeloyl-ACP methyl ester carboxylesterase